MSLAYWLTTIGSADPLADDRLTSVKASVSFFDSSGDVACSIGEVYSSNSYRFEVALKNQTGSTFEASDIRASCGCVAGLTSQVSCQDKFGPKPADTAQCNNDLCTFVCDGPQSVFLARPTWETDVDRATITPKGQWGKKGTLGTHKCTVTRTCDCRLNDDSGTYKCKGSVYQVLESFATPNFNDPVEICVGR